MKGLEKILTIEMLGIGYGAGSGKNTLLPPLSADAVKGELVAVIGRNGIGKSTLLRTLAGIQEQKGGVITCLGRNIRDYSPKELALVAGYISTESIRISSMRVYDLVALGRYPHTSLLGNMSAEDHAAIASALDNASIRHCSGKFVAELSDGERQKANIARLLAQDSGIMLMDEPAAFLDIGSKFEVFNLMYNLCHENRKTIVCTTHDLDMAVRYADKIWLLLETGLLQGSPEDLMINGQFEQFFKSSSLVFNSDEGTWSFRENSGNKIHVIGSGRVHHWTCEALKRAGFSVSEEMTRVCIDIQPGPAWVLLTPSEKTEHHSVYELIAALTDSSSIFKNGFI